MRILSLLSRSGIGLIGLFNWALGTLLLVYVIWTLNTAGNFHLIASGKSIITISELIFGLLVSIKGLLGIFGACQKQDCLLKLFLFLAVMTVSIEVGTFISLRVTKVQLSDLVEQSWNEAASATRNYVQRELSCCGLTGLSEFASKLDPIDDSCYEPGNSSPNRQPYRIGCKPKLIDWIQRSKKRFIGLTLALLIVQIISIVLVLLQLRYSKPYRSSRSALDQEFNDQILLTRRPID